MFLYAGLDKWVGSTEKKMAAFFSLIKKLISYDIAPVILMDEVDAVISRPDHTSMSSSSMRSLLLDFLGGFDGKPEGLYMVATTNEIWK